ncbi:MAG: hypothetical protein ABSB84_15350 [Verrucomicrobiota bacterium]|jgi:hypothetical protein
MTKRSFTVLFLASAVSLQAGDLDTIGVTLLWTVTTNLNGTGIHVAQVEASSSSLDFEVNPNVVGQPTNLFTYYSTNGSATNFPNPVGTESGHADSVAAYFYGQSGGVATNVVHVDNYDANYFWSSNVDVSSQINIHDPVVNQSFIFTGTTVGQQQAIDSQYDNYAARYNTLFVSGVGNGGAVNPPASCYNGIGVAAYGGGSCTGPTLDNGRAKPDITAPATETSYSTPQVAGAAAVIEQAGLRGDGGSDTNGAADLRTVKALLLNGAIKPGDWTNGPASPLDARYGAGVLNVFNSHKQLAGGRHGYTVSNSVSLGGMHPPTGASGTVSTLCGWDFNTNTSSSSSDGVNHYYFNVTNDVNDATFTATATLVWNRQRNQSAINNLNLFLYNAANSNLVAVSTSAVDNVEHLFVPNHAQGRYDLQVWKAGGSYVSSSETYALAFEFFNLPLSDQLTNNNLVISWPVAPTGFQLQAAAGLNPPVSWTTVTNAVTITNNQNVVSVTNGSGSQFFRLIRPSF